MTIKIYVMILHSIIFGLIWYLHHNFSEGKDLHSPTNRLQCPSNRSNSEDNEHLVTTYQL